MDSQIGRMAAPRPWGSSGDKQLDTTPGPPLAKEVDPLAGVGTLADQAKRAAGKRKQSKFEQAAEVVSRTRGAVKLSQLGAVTRDMTDALADVESFAKLIDDRVVSFDQLSVAVQRANGRRLRCALELRCENPPPSRGCAKVPPPPNANPELVMIPTGGFMQSVARYIVSNTPIYGLTGTFLSTLGTQTSGDLISNISRLGATKDLLNHLLSELQLAFKPKQAGKAAKKVLLRTLKPDHKGRWPKKRSARAILHEGYRDDISHLWVMREMARLIPSGRIDRYYFDGNLLRGAVIIPSICRQERDSEYRGGIMFFSGEIGNRRAGALPFIYRTVSRSITIAGNTWGVTHNARPKLDDLQLSLESAIHRQIPLISTEIDRMLKAQEITFGEDDPFAVERLLIALSNSFRMLTQKDLRLWRIGVSTERKLIEGMPLSAFTLQNGLTRMSQSVEDIVRQLQLEQVAGDLLGVDWDAIVDRAKTIDDEQVCSVFKTE